MTTDNINTATISQPLFVSTDDLLKEWQGHRRLTRRVIEAFPEDQLFEFSIGGMRTFADMMKEIIDISGPGVRGIATDDWANTGGFSEHSLQGEDRSKAGLLRLFDQGTEEINAYFSKISTERFQENVLAFGMYEGQVFSTILYFIDNEVHHRGQGTVYLRGLGIEPPAFWNRD